jgi:hypothetical protein
MDFASTTPGTSDIYRDVTATANGVRLAFVKGKSV